jgi:hypothetical protein
MTRVSSLHERLAGRDLQATEYLEETRVVRLSELSFRGKPLSRFVLR